MRERESEWEEDVLRIKELQLPNGLVESQYHGHHYYVRQAAHYSKKVIIVNIGIPTSKADTSQNVVVFSQR